MTTKPPKNRSNDTKRNRLTPIPGTIHNMRGYPTKLVIYKTDASRFFWVRNYFNGKYHYKSTKTENLKDAQIIAIRFYEQTLVNASTTKTSDKSKSFAVVANRFFESAKHSTKDTVYRTDHSRYKNDLLPSFAEQEIDTITNSQISNLMQRLSERNLSPATIKHFMVVLRKIFKFAVANDLMSHIPVFPKVSGRLTTTQKRDYLTQDEYEELVSTAENLAKKQVLERGVLITDEMKYLIQFMVNSFIRPSDLRVLKHKHIKKMQEDGDEWLVLNHPATKTNATEVQAMPVSVHIYDRLVKFKKSKKLRLGLDEYVFFPEYENRNTAMEVIARLFRRITKESLIQQKTGKNITLYSLRHTAIMLRLIIGKVDSLALARNARTSQQMVDKFYGSHLTTQHARKQLHAFPNAEKKSNQKTQITKKQETPSKPVKKAVSAKKSNLTVKEAKKATSKAAPKAVKPRSKRKTEPPNG